MFGPFGTIAVQIGRLLLPTVGVLSASRKADTLLVVLWSAAAVVVVALSFAEWRERIVLSPSGLEVVESPFGLRRTTLEFDQIHLVFRVEPGAFRFAELILWVSPDQGRTGRRSAERARKRCTPHEDLVVDYQSRHPGLRAIRLNTGSFDDHAWQEIGRVFIEMGLLSVDAGDYPLARQASVSSSA